MGQKEANFRVYNAMDFATRTVSRLAARAG